MRSSRTLTGSSRAATLTAVVLFAAACAGSATDIAPVTAAPSSARTQLPIAIESPAETATPATEPPVEIDLGPLTGTFPTLTVSSGPGNIDVAMPLVLSTEAGGTCDAPLVLRYAFESAFDKAAPVVLPAGVLRTEPLRLV
jgi:hypothetical protein